MWFSHTNADTEREFVAIKIKKNWQKHLWSAFTMLFPCSMQRKQKVASYVPFYCEPSLLLSESFLRFSTWRPINPPWWPSHPCNLVNMGRKRTWRGLSFDQLQTILIWYPICYSHSPNVRVTSGALLATPVVRGWLTCAWRNQDITLSGILQAANSNRKKHRAWKIQGSFPQDLTKLVYTKAASTSNRQPHSIYTLKIILFLMGLVDKRRSLAGLGMTPGVGRLTHFLLVSLNYASALFIPMCAAMTVNWVLGWDAATWRKEKRLNNSWSCEMWDACFLHTAIWAAPGHSPCTPWLTVSWVTEIRPSASCSLMPVVRQSTPIWYYLCEMLRHRSLKA